MRCRRAARERCRVSGRGMCDCIGVLVPGELPAVGRGRSETCTGRPCGMCAGGCRAGLGICRASRWRRCRELM